jgi:TolA-binding protein
MQQLARRIAAFVLVASLAGAPPARAVEGQVDDKVMDELAQDAARFQEAARNFRNAASIIIKRAYFEKIRAIRGKYEPLIAMNEREERERRFNAIAMFERFLRKYPNDKRWTPDAMFRLAELYFEKSQDDFLTAQDNYQKALDSLNPPTVDQPPKPDYTNTVNLYKKLLAEFPSYRLLDAAYYLLGYCLGEMGQEAEGRQVLLALTCGNKYRPFDPPPPPRPASGGPLSARGAMADPYKDCEPVKKESKFVPEAWTRVGEMHFDAAELPEAIAAYTQVLKYKDSAYYDKALYKLAWSYYRDNRFPEAIREFDGLVKWADEKKAAGDKFGSDLRPEAVQYLGISFGEPDWDGDTVNDLETGLQRLENFYRGRENEPHVKEVYQRLGDIYFDQTKYPEAVAVYKALLAKWPYYSDAPRVQEKIVKAHERNRDLIMAAKEREMLGRNYTKGSEWSRQNQGNPEALAIAEQLSEEALLIAATNVHAGAQACSKAAEKDPVKKAECKGMYRTSAELYEKYLAAYPNSKQAYDYASFYADALYYSDQFEAAINAYTNLRDSILDNKHQQLAAFMIIKSYEDIITRMKAAKQLDEPPIPDEQNTKPPVAPMAMPEVFQRYLGALDWYTNNLKDERVADLRYAAAVLQLRYRQWPEARGRLMQLTEAYCKEKPAIGFQAYDAILKTYFIDYAIPDEEQKDCALGRLLSMAEQFTESPCSKSPEATKYLSRIKEIKTSVKSSVIAQRLKIAQENEEKGTDKQLTMCRDGAGGIAIVTGVAAPKAAGPGAPGAPGAAPSGAASKVSTELDEGLALDLIDLVNENPKDSDAHKNLNNACYTYQKIFKLGEATKCYERLARDYLDTPEGKEAVWLAAKAHEQFFEFDQAVTGFLKIATDPKFSQSEHRKEAIGNAAVLLDNDQQYQRAAGLYKQYSDTISDKPADAAQAHFQSCSAWEKLKDVNKQRQCLNDLIRRFGNQPPAGEFVVESYLKLAYLTEQTSKSKSDILRGYQKVRDEFINRKLPPATPAATAAAKAEYLLLDEKFNAFKGKQLRIYQAKTAQKIINDMIAEAKALQTEYQKVWEYKDATWSLAAFLRRGDIFYEFGQKLLKAGDVLPDDLQKLMKQCGRDQECKDGLTTQYKDALAGFTTQIEDEAKSQWKATLARAAELGVTNEYVKKARENLSKYLPDEFPFIKDERVQLEAP